ncbi:CbiX/SirB N-terminal domain-containing protein [Burkholderia gladioli]|uniref:sirohydrochlorin chelatase n=1 Tax=Burkholderia gladioli TaxID=28095 RepID=UPI001C248C3D|nr:CbiX/SirB N-terminal domain-containing protein [Burkholderia gladioli]MBU9217598.1 CbiX/SirB N-terminal domain-containing protein [Burkholderia gladioli]MDN7727811.1 CbiX/SirB N-terminal domain-containing protein [Burkholderia gladioli]
MSRHGIILFGHGSRDPRWMEPFERLAERVRASHTSGPVALAFLELMPPELEDAVAAHVTAGCATVTVVPVFVGQGGHVRRDLPEIVEACRAAHPGVDIRCATAIGEDDSVLDAIATYCLQQAGD